VTKALAMDDAMMDNLLAAAKLLPTHSRDCFLRSVGSKLANIDTPTNEDLSAAITAVLNSRGVTASLFMTDAKSTK
jgi:hypothetical protein